MSGYSPTERDLYQAHNPLYAEQWDRMDEVMYCPPSYEVFMHGLKRAASTMKRIIPAAEYVGWLMEWAQERPQTMKEAP